MASINVRAPSTPSASVSGFGILADTRQLSSLARDLRRASPQAWAECRRELRVVANVVKADAQQRASFSSRIPGTIRVRTGAGNVKVIAGGEAAPHAPALEHHGEAGTFRHPLWGKWDPPAGGYQNHGKQWIDGDPRNQKARPFLAPAFEARQEFVLDGLERAVTGAVERAIRGGGL